MGKNLKGKECGKGICQRKDGLYSARYVDELGNRHQKYFPTLPEARRKTVCIKWCKNGVITNTLNEKTIGNKGDMSIYEIRYRWTAQRW